ncbi:restriction endonuclease subunit S [Helicobacter suis]|uniref:restriction endonuclease subunit S n=1 Tax=Helicobacter suis TaxID=104628 RepID=UPI0013D7B752|nr:restriction endonuclease subunit S [Helicobacter suis]
MKKVKRGDLIITTTSEDLEGVCRCVAWLGEAQIVTGGHTAIFKHNQNPKFIAYWFASADFTGQKRKIAYGTKVTEVKPKNLSDFLIPLPPLLIQEKIASILDQLQALSSDLEQGIPAEIRARKKQFNYYLNHLLDFKGQA